MDRRQVHGGSAAGSRVRFVLEAFVAVCALGMSNILASDYLGDGQSEEVNAILNPEVLIVRNGFGQDLIAVPVTRAVLLVPLGQGGSSAELQFRFSGARPETFSASLGKLPLSTANLSADGVQVVGIPILSGRNRVVASVSGTSPSDKGGRDVERTTP